MTKRFPAFVTVLLVMTSIPFVNIALASETPRLHFESSLVGSTPHNPVAGIPSGGASWIISEGNSVLSPGILVLNTHDLVITGTGTAIDGTTGPVKQVFASLVCADTTVVASTDPVPFNPDGNANIAQTIHPLSSCLSPIILVRAVIPSSAAHPWIAETVSTGQ
jgi:hypothetical protein